MAKGAKEITQVSLTEVASDCATECIKVGKESGATSTTGIYAGTKTAIVSISNTATDVIFRFSGTESIMRVKINGIEFFCGDGTSMDLADEAVNRFTFPIGIFGEEWSQCETKEYTAIINRNNCNDTGGGNEVTIEAIHNLVPVCDYEDEEGEKILICHKLKIGNNWKFITLNIPLAALQAHLDHGDELEACD